MVNLINDVSYFSLIDFIFCRNGRSQPMMTPGEKQGEFEALVSDSARPFLVGRTDRFVNELELFLASGFNIEAFDEVYRQQLGWTAPEITNETADVECTEKNKPVMPYLYIFDEDSDESD